MQANCTTRNISGSGSGLGGRACRPATSPGSIRALPGRDRCDAETQLSTMGFNRAVNKVLRCESCWRVPTSHVDSTCSSLSRFVRGFPNCVTNDTYPDTHVSLIILRPRSQAPARSSDNNRRCETHDYIATGRTPYPRHRSPGSLKATRLAFATNRRLPATAHGGSCVGACALGVQTNRVARSLGSGYSTERKSFGGPAPGAQTGHPARRDRRPGLQEPVEVRPT